MKVSYSRLTRDLSESGEEDEQEFSCMALSALLVLRLPCDIIHTNDYFLQYLNSFQPVKGIECLLTLFLCHLKHCYQRVSVYAVPLIIPEHPRRIYFERWDGLEVAGDGTSFDFQLQSFGKVTILRWVEAWRFEEVR